jgi:pyrroloquinoline-quinone synthase
VGVNEEVLWMSAPLPAVEALLDIYGKICGEGSLAEAVAALYAYEAQVPEIATTKMDGLRRYYNVTSGKAWLTSQSMRKPTACIGRLGGVG